MPLSALPVCVLLLTLFDAFHLGRSFTVKGTNEHFYALSAVDATGQNIPMSSYVGKVLLVVNVASECGYTHTHYHDLVKLQQDLEFSGLFDVLAFPCNQFGQQEPKDISEIVKFTSSVYNVNFRLFDKVDVIGDTASPLWTFLKEETGHEPGWNFWKYLIDHQGNVVGLWGPETSVAELSAVVRTAVEAAGSYIKHLPISDDSARQHPNIIREL